MESNELSVRQKALRINLDPAPYGSFAEIGAGQEVAALFFKAGAASGTIAKTISAYDMTFSDSIYGPEESGRYVCESRLLKMIDKEYYLVEKRLKGKERPINKQETRSLILASLLMVDAVIIFEEDTPLELIDAIKPDVLVKGGDYTIEQIVGAKEVIANCGRVVINPIVEGYSTTNLIEKLKN